MQYCNLPRAISRILVLLGLLGLPATCRSAGPATPLPLQSVMDLPLPGDTSRLDYASLDPDRHLLFVAHLGANEVIVVDTETLQVINLIRGIKHVHGVLAIPELARVFASATGTDEVVAIDESSMAVTARMPGGAYPDGMTYAPAQHKLYVSDEHGNTETVIDVRTNQRTGTIPLGGEVGNSQFDPVSGHVFVNVQSRQQLVEIDPALDRIVARFKLPGAEGNHGLLIIPSKRLAVIACEDSSRLLVFDLKSHRISQSFDVGKGPDVLAFDDTLNVLYVASESGVASLFRLVDGSLSKIAEGFAGPNAHVVAIHPATHQVYFPIADLNGRPVLRILLAPP